jgi:hypothetical protein
MVTLTLTTLGCTPTTESEPTPTLLPAQTPLPDLAPSLTPAAAAILETIEGSFPNQIRILEKYMPRADSEKYVIPSARERSDFANLVSLIYAEDLAKTVALAGDLHYRLNFYVDRGDDYAMHYLLRELRPIEKGWGLYALRMNSASNIIIEAPHPLFDRRTPSVALDIYRALDARALLIAGAQRHANRDGSADVAHQTDSIFHAVHETLSKKIKTTAGDVIILQIHGFHSSNHAGYPTVVVGFGKEMDPGELSLAQKLETAFSEQGVRVGLCNEETWNELCGRKNSQGSSPDGTTFLHMELDESIRKNDDVLIAALVQVFGP